MKVIKERKEIVLDPKVFDLYVGKYQPPTPAEPITVTREGDMFMVTFGTEPQGHRLYAESEKKFFLKDADLTITFQTGSTGRANSMTVNFGGTESLAPRLEAGLDKQ